MANVEGSMKKEGQVTIALNKLETQLDLLVPTVSELNTTLEKILHPQLCNSKALGSQKPSSKEISVPLAERINTLAEKCCNIDCQIRDIKNRCSI